MRKRGNIVILLNCFIVALFIVFKANPTNAVTITIPSYPSTISSDPFTLTASVSGALAGTNYLRIDLFKESTTDYFGDTFNGTDWYNGSDYNQYFPITIETSTPWMGDIQSRTGSSVENGNYKLRIRRYTSSGSQSASDPIDINLNIPTPTSISTPEITLTETPTLTPTLEITLTPSPTPTNVPTLTITPDLAPTSAPISYNYIYLSEIMAYPDTNENEWVEIYNNNDYSVSLLNWYIDDIENTGSTPKSFSIDISPNSYAVINFTSSMFNNNGDSVRLLDFNKNLKDSFEYSNSTKGKTLARASFDSDNFCIQDATKGFANGTCIISPTQAPEPTKPPASGIKPTNTPKEKTPTPTKKIIASGNISTNDNDTNITIQTPNKETMSESEITLDNPPEVLGFSTKQNNNISKPILQSFSFASFSFSLLVIVSILIKLFFPTHYKLPTNR